MKTSGYVDDYITVNYRRESGARFQMLYADNYLVAVCNRT